MYLHDTFKRMRSTFRAMALYGQLPFNETCNEIAQSSLCLVKPWFSTKASDHTPRLRPYIKPYTARDALEKMNQSPPFQPNFAKEDNAECMVFEINTQNPDGTSSPTIIAIRRPRVGSHSYERDLSEYQLTQLTSDNESHMYMLQKGCRTWAVRVKGKDPDYIRREMTNHMVVYENMNRFWYFSTCHMDRVGTVESDIGMDPDRKKGAERKKRKSLSSPHVPLPEEQGLVYRSCESDSAVTGFVMEYIPPMSRDHMRALANMYIDPKVRDFVKRDPDLKRIRFLVQFGRLSPLDEAMSPRLSSRPVYVNQFWEEDTWSLRNCAKQMGATLAILHWACRLDAAGVKFHIAPKFRKPGLWLTNFGDCKLLETEDDTTAMAEACYNNLTWPRPRCAFNYTEDPELRDCIEATWSWFAHAYVSTSHAILAEETGGPAKSLPICFIGKVVCLAGGTKFSEGRRYEDWLIGQWRFIEAQSATTSD
ncbi:hypothetical protein FHETE_2208 [Fusarium heterosporum]|uniref:DUF3669 domain-containing protein n=1 Tax=Fusarium heterosporum TaxID=42747 RepID=A0A8H5WUK2_FUSHE|nr:hypothetical protein FHETE_2208 [Fusarium heterosporum]